MIVEIFLYRRLILSAFCNILVKIISYPARFPISNIKSEILRLDQLDLLIAKEAPLPILLREGRGEMPF